MLHNRSLNGQEESPSVESSSASITTAAAEGDLFKLLVGDREWAYRLLDGVQLIDGIHYVCLTDPDARIVTVSNRYDNARTANGIGRSFMALMGGVPGRVPAGDVIARVDQRPRCGHCDRTFDRVGEAVSHVAHDHGVNRDDVVTDLPPGPDLTVRPSSPRPFVCRYCRETFATISPAEWHIYDSHGLGYRARIAHPKRERFGCRVCDRRFAYAVERDRHERRSHVGAPILKGGA